MQREGCLIKPWGGLKLRGLLRREEYSHCNSKNKKSPLWLWTLQKPEKKGLTASRLLAPQCRTLSFPSASARLPLARVPLVSGAAVWLGWGVSAPGWESWPGRQGRRRKKADELLPKWLSPWQNIVCMPTDKWLFFVPLLCKEGRGQLLFPCVAWAKKPSGLSWGNSPLM